MWEGMTGWERGRISCRLPLLSQPPSHQSPWWGGRVQPAQNIATPAHFDVKILPPSPLNVKNRTPSHSQSSKYCMGGSCYAKIKVSQDPKDPLMKSGSSRVHKHLRFTFAFKSWWWGSITFWMISSSPNQAEPFFCQTLVGLCIYYQSLVEFVRTMPNCTN